MKGRSQPKTSAQKPALKYLVGKDLAGFTVQEYTEAYKTDMDGRKERSLGYFKDEAIAKAFVGRQVDSAWYKTERVLLLTNGTVGFLLGQAVKLVDNEQAKLKMKQAAMAKLTPDECRALGLS
jgi:hypothetical protein